jgi:hypothetical protein
MRAVVDNQEPTQGTAPARLVALSTERIDRHSSQAATARNELLSIFISDPSLESPLTGQIDPNTVKTGTKFLIVNQR